MTSVTSIVYCQRLEAVYVHIECMYRFYGYSKDQLSKLFDSLIMSLFYYGIEIRNMGYI